MPPPIRGYIENTMLDWEGKLAAVIFLPGCNFRCAYCHARHLIEPTPPDEAIPIEAVLSSLQRQRGWVDGIVISGGEPTLYPDLPELISFFRVEGIGVKLDTNGSRPDMLERLLGRGIVDHVAMDIKAPLDHRYSEVAGVEVDLDAIRRSIELLMSSDIPYEFRTTACPSQLGEDEIAGIAQAVRGARHLYLQAFRPVNCLDRSFENIKPYNSDEMRTLSLVASRYVERCSVRGDEASEHVTAEVN